MKMVCLFKFNNMAKRQEDNNMKERTTHYAIKETPHVTKKWRENCSNTIIKMFVHLIIQPPGNKI